MGVHIGLPHRSLQINPPIVTPPKQMCLTKADVDMNRPGNSGDSVM